MTASSTGATAAPATATPTSKSPALTSAWSSTPPPTPSSPLASPKPPPPGSVGADTSSDLEIGASRFGNSAVLSPRAEDSLRDLLLPLHRHASRIQQRAAIHFQPVL